MPIAFHFLLLAIGEILKVDGCVTSQDIQDYLQNDAGFGVRVPLHECRMALKLMEDSGFIKKSEGEKYIWMEHNEK